MGAGRELWAPVAIFVAFATTLVFTIPPFEAPDEPSHLAYVNFVAERVALPNQGDEAQTVSGQGHQAPFYYLVVSRLVRVVKTDHRVWVDRRPNTEHVWHGGERIDVPLYRHAGAPPFPSTRDRVGFYLLRLLSVALAAATIVCVGLTAQLVLGTGAGAIAALLTATLPQFAAVGAAITADDLAQLLAAFFAWQLIGGVLQPAESARFTRAGVALGLALLTKKTALCLVPGAALALGAAVLVGRIDWPTAVRRLAQVLGIAFVLFLPWLVRNQRLYGDPLGSAMERATLHALVAEKSLSDPWWWTTFAPWIVSSFTGVLGWMNLWLPRPVYAWYARSWRSSPSPGSGCVRRGGRGGRTSGSPSPRGSSSCASRASSS